MPIHYPTKVADLLEHADQYHRQFYQKQTFFGPSLHFHRRALQSWKADDLEPCLELIYATLTSWGMHRMGKGGSKMKSLEEFAGSILPLVPQIQQARAFTPANMREEDWQLLRSIFVATEVMASQTKIVGNSKVMAHLMPNIIPPIDREYTLKFLTGHKNIKNDLEAEWKWMRVIIEKLFIPVALDENFQQLAHQWMADPTRHPWDTSIFKIIDNLIIGRQTA
jgi:hypothetical protein